jgi:uncharacterized protein (UPF0303 family)
MTYEHQNLGVIPRHGGPAYRAHLPCGRVMVDLRRHDSREPPSRPPDIKEPAVTEPADLQALIAHLEQQQEQLQFSRFTNDDAWDLGSLLVGVAQARGLVLTVDIRRHGHQLFHAALPGTTPDNDIWIERKIRVVNRFGNSSYLVGRRLALADRVLDEGAGVEPILYAPHGGSFPIIVRDVGVVGTVTVSGLPQADDHALVVEVLRTFLGVPQTP